MLIYSKTLLHNLSSANKIEGSPLVNGAGKREWLAERATEARGLSLSGGLGLINWALALCNFEVFLYKELLAKGYNYEQNMAFGGVLW